MFDTGVQDEWVQSNLIPVCMTLVFQMNGISQIISLYVSSLQTPYFKVKVIAGQRSHLLNVCVSVYVLYWCWHSDYIPICE